jgi:hypothetical protein
MKPETIEKSVESVPMKRPGQPAEFGGAYRDPLSRYVSGAGVAMTGAKPLLEIASAPGLRSELRAKKARKAKKVKVRKKAQKAKTTAVKKWSQKVTETSDAMTLDEGVFKKTPKATALSIKRSAERSNRRKATPYRSAMSMLTFYENRAGKNLSAARRKKLETAKDELRALYDRD